MSTDLNGEAAPVPRQPADTIERSFAVELPLRYDVRVPADAATPLPLLLALHGYGGSKRQMMRESLLLAPDDFVVACPQGIYQHIREPRERDKPLRFGFGWLTNYRAEESVSLHHAVVLRVIGELAGENLVDPRRVFLLGFSQSCALNYRFAFTHADVLRGVIGVCGGLPGDWETSATYRETKAGVLHLAGARDEFYPPARTADYATLLGSRAADVGYKSYDAGHEMTDEMRRDVRAWLTRRAAVKTAMSKGEADGAKNRMRGRVAALDRVRRAGRGGTDAGGARGEQN